MVEVRDRIAHSVFDGFEYFREYIRALFLKGTPYVDIYRDIHIGDQGFRLLAGVFTPRRINTLGRGRLGGLSTKPSTNT